MKEILQTKQCEWNAKTLYTGINKGQLVKMLMNYPKRNTLKDIY